ncbi:hypothetical protein [Actinophytocola sp.]|uniref:hypothetical protein n=1 Tax=Actinophytocola sp. TaxID=1872138 RepID=UPI003D6A4F87
MVVKAVALLASVLLLGACSDSSGEGDTSGPRTETTLENLTSQRLCELLPNDAIERALDVVVTDAKGRRSGRPRSSARPAGTESSSR